MRERFEQQMAIVAKQIGAAVLVEAPPANPAPVESTADADPESSSQTEVVDRADSARKRARRAWGGMVERCFKAAQSSMAPLDTYVHREWRRDFECFLRDMGLPEENAYLKRIDAERPYMPGNCLWACRNGGKARRKDESGRRRESDRQTGDKGKAVHRVGALPSDDQLLMSRNGRMFDGSMFASDMLAHRAFHMRLKDSLGALQAVCAHVGARDSVILQKTASGQYVLIRTWFEKGRERACAVVTADERTAHDWYVGLISLHWKAANRMAGRRGV